MTASNSHSFTTQPTTKLIWQNTLPMIGAILALFSYDVLESTLIAFQRENVLAAFGFTLPITAAMTALAIGLSIRSNNKIIQNNCNAPHAIPSEIVNALVITVAIVACFSLLFFGINNSLLTFLGSSQWATQVPDTQVAQSQNTYLTWRYLGWIFMALIWQSNAILRALGWMKQASALMFSWMVVKSLLAIMALTPESPFYQESFAQLGIVHFITDASFAFISLFVITKKVNFNASHFKLNLHCFLRQKRHGTLVVIQQFITPISMAVLTAIAAQIDASYVAALALLFRLEVLIMLLPMVLTTSVPTIVGANYWLGHKGRVRDIYITTFLFIVIIQLIVAAIIYSQSHILSSLICPHNEVSSHLNHYLQWVPWGYAAAGVAIVFQSCLNAKNHTVHATLLAVTHRIVLVLPLTIMGATLFETSGFYQGLMLGHLSAILPILYLANRFKLFSQNSTKNSNNNLEGLQHET